MENIYHSFSLMPIKAAGVTLGYGLLISSNLDEFASQYIMYYNHKLYELNDIHYDKTEMFTVLANSIYCDEWDVELDRLIAKREEAERNAHNSDIEDDLPF